MSSATDGTQNAEFAENLSVGSTGSDVEKLQQKLQELELYSDPIDGLFGLGVEQAVKEFQVNQGLADDGVAGVGVLEELGLLIIEREPLDLPEKT